MAVLQTYQADLLKDLNNGQGLSPEAVSKLRRTMDLSLRATKQTAAAIDCSIKAEEVSEAFLAQSLGDQGKEKIFFLLPYFCPLDLLALPSRW